jgi:hypothetical protein
MTPERRQELTGIFHAALAPSATDRSRFLDEPCGADASRRPEVGALLAAYDKAAVGSEWGQTGVRLGSDSSLTPH